MPPVTCFFLAYRLFPKYVLSADQSPVFAFVQVQWMQQDVGVSVTNALRFLAFVDMKAASHSFGALDLVHHTPKRKGWIVI